MVAASASRVPAPRGYNKPVPARVARGRRSARPLSWAIGKIAAKSFKARGLAAAGIVGEWRAIVGEALAACSWPDRLQRNGTLRVRVAGPVAVELQHLEPQILDRIAAYYGYRAATRIVYVQAAPVAPAPHARRPAPPLDPVRAARIERAVSETRDSRLKNALGALGRALLAGRDTR